MHNNSTRNLYLLNRLAGSLVLLIVKEKVNCTTSSTVTAGLCKEFTVAYGVYDLIAF